MLESLGSFWILLAICYGVVLVLDACGFKKFVYFLSVGYGLSVLGIGVCLLVFTLGKFEFLGITGNGIANFVLIAALMLYGLRLAGFLLYREIKSASYRRTLEKVSGAEEKKMPVFVKATIWIFCGILYLMETYPVIFRVASSAPSQGVGLICPLIGAFVAVFGLVLETVADLQKSAAKKVNPHAFVSTGLFRFVRCPNYLGEIIFWTGIFVSGCDIFQGDWPAWVISALGYVLIVYVMFSGAKRLELRQQKSYGSDPAYQEYVRKTPILMHLIPIKSLADVNWIK